MNDSGLITQPVENPVCSHCHGALPAGLAPLEHTVCPNCGRDTLVPGILQQQYRITDLIGKGGMGAVYEAYDVGLDRQVAVKVILREKALSDPDFAEAFLREARSVSKLVDEHVVVYYMTNTCEGQPFLVMELVKADSLDRMMASGPVNPYAVLDIGCQTAQGLKAANSLGLVHGDVKPDNILINAERKAKIADFGIAAASGARSGSGNEVWGTPYYIAPETLRKQKIDHRADIYSLGATLYHAIAGIPPFEGEDEIAVMQGRLLGPARPLTEVAPGCPEAIAKIIMRMLEADPIRRYPNYDALIHDMEKVQGTAKKSLTGSHKRLVIKTKAGTRQLTAPAAVSAPMPSVTDAPEEQSKPGLSRGVLFGLLGGGALTVLIILGTVLWLLLRTADEELAEPPSDAAVVQDAAEAARAAALAELDRARDRMDTFCDTVIQRAARAADRAAGAARTVAHMAQQARRSTLEEHTAWLSPSDEPAPTAMLADLQKFYKNAAEIKAAADAADELKKAVAKLKAEADAQTESAAPVDEARAKAEALSAAYGKTDDRANTLANTLKSRERSWKHTVHAARREMEEAVKAKFAAERKAKAERKKAEAAERLKEAIAAEVATVATFEPAVASLLDSFDTAAALKEVSDLAGHLRYAESKRAAEAVTDRIRCLNTLKHWLIEDANAGRLGITRLRKATETTVRLGSAEIPWKQFCAEGQIDLAKIFTQRIADAAGSKGLLAGQRAELAVAARLFIARYVGSDILAKSPVLRRLMKDLAEVADALPGSQKLRARTEGLGEAAAGDEAAE